VRTVLFSILEHLGFDPKIDIFSKNSQKFYELYLQKFILKKSLKGFKLQASKVLANFGGSKIF